MLRIVVLSALLTIQLATSARADPSGSPAVETLPGEINIAPPPQPAKPREESNAPKLPMRFSIAQDSDRNPLTLYVQRGVTKLGLGNVLGDGYYEPLCHGQCEFKLRAGTHMFAVTSEGGRTIKLDRALKMERGQELVVKYRSRRVHRIVGWCVLAALVGSGVAMYSLAQPRKLEDEGQLKTGYVVGGSVLVVSGLLSGLWLANLPDKATGWVR